MELRQIEYVVGVADHEGFSRAAEALFVSQPSLSQGVTKLEAELGVALFARLGRRVAPTAAGEAFVAAARLVLRDLTGVRAAVADVIGLRAGHLDVVALPTLAADPLAGLIGAFRARAPEVTVRVFEPEEAGSVGAFVRSGRADVGLAELGEAEGDLDAQPFVVQELFAVAPPGTPVPSAGRVRIASLSRVPIVTTPPGTSTRRLLDEAFAAKRVHARIAVETSEREAILPLVLAGAGMSFLPGPLADQAASRGAVVAPLSPRIRRRIGLLTRSGAASPAVAAFLAIARGRGADR